MAEFVDPYLYLGTEVLRNLRGERDPIRASQHERRMTLLRRRELELDPVKGTFDLDHICEIHRRLFQDVWGWAGRIRTVDITKGSSNFISASYIRTAFTSVDSWMAEETALLSDANIGDSDFVTQAADLLEKVNYIHAFREGNGRTQRAYLDQVASLSGRTLSWRNFGKVENERASIRAFAAGSGEPLRPLPEGALAPPMDGLSLLDEQLYSVTAPVAAKDALPGRFTKYPELRNMHAPKGLAGRRPELFEEVQSSDPEDPQLGS